MPVNGLRALFWAACFLLSPSMESCARSSALPTVPANAVALVPPPAYSLWWQLTEECSGRTGDLNRIRWYVVPSAQHLRINGLPADGYWRGDTIVLADSAKLAGSLVRHEMLHA